MNLRMSIVRNFTRPLSNTLQSRKVQVGDGHEKAQSERNSHSKIDGGEN